VREIINAVLYAGQKVAGTIVIAVEIVRKTPIR